MTVGDLAVEFDTSCEFKRTGMNLPVIGEFNITEEADIPTGMSAFRPI